MQLTLDLSQHKLIESEPEHHLHPQLSSEPYSILARKYNFLHRPCQYKFQIVVCHQAKKARLKTVVLSQLIYGFALGYQKPG